MSDENKQTTEPVKNTVVEDVAKTSKVSKKSSKSMASKVYWILGALILMVLVSMIFSGGKPKNDTQEAAAENTGGYSTQAELRQNMEKLQISTKKIVEHLAAIGQPTLEKPQVTKEYIARQHAPTSMYEHTEVGGASSGEGEVTTLADKSFNATFANNAGKGAGVQEAYRVAHPRFTIASGEFINAVLETAISSDLPGELRAVITSPVYAYIGERPLIPAGSRLIGQYSSSVLQGQNRVMIVWDRIILPNGIAINVASPGADELGRSGQGADAVNHHFFARFGEAALLSLIGAGAATYGVNSSDQNNSAAQYRMAIAESFQESANQSLQGTMAIKPTIHVYQGAQINVFVAHDLSFYNVLNHA